MIVQRGFVMSSLVPIFLLILVAVTATLLLSLPGHRLNDWQWCDEPSREPYCGFVREEYQSGDIDGLVYLLFPQPVQLGSTFFPSAAMVLAEFERLHPTLRVLEFSVADGAAIYRLRARDARSG